MTRSERLDLIEQLQRSKAEHLANLARRQEERERDPLLMDDYIRSDPSFNRRSEPIGTPLVQRDADPGGLVFKQIDDAMVEPAQPQDDPSQWEGWQRWLDGNIAIEREGMRDEIAAFVVEIFRRERLAVDRKLSELQNENVELRGMLTDVLKRLDEFKHIAAEIETERRTREATFGAIAEKLAALGGKVDGRMTQLANIADTLGLLPRGFDVT